MPRASVTQTPSRAGASPWAWRVSASGWYADVARGLAVWQPDPALEVDSVVRDRLVEAACNGEEWLYHPVLCAVTLGQRRLGRDLRLVLWAGAHSEDRADLGAVTVPGPTWAWAADGGRLVERGRHDVVELGRRACTPATEPLVPLALDVWIDAVGLPLPPEVVAYEEWSWAHHQPLAPEEGAHLRHDVVRFLRAARALQQLHPDCSDWVTGVTKVVVPLYGTSGPRFRSGSSAALPGLVFTDIDGPITQVLESLVHESAHLWFCIAETECPLIDPAHDGRYRSPLRPDPRPLRGIFLAFHALAFMGAFYRDWAGVTPARDEALDELEAVRSLRDDAAATLESARDALTDAGAQFLDATLRLPVAHAG
jgi:HEXXH motif-containing protein